jgi:hypothetical protein
LLKTTLEIPEIPKENAMTTNLEEQELKDRLNLIESMIAEGRRTTESWGWTFVLWGVADYVAIAWAVWGHYSLAWPVTMGSAFVLTWIFHWRRGGSGPETTVGRAIRSIWITMAISMFILFDALGFNGRLTDWRLFAAVAATLLGTANAASSMTLKWKLQFACAVVWWAAAVVSCFGTESQCMIGVLAAIFLCQIVFGIYGMIAVARVRRLGDRHA